MRSGVTRAVFVLVGLAVGASRASVGTGAVPVASIGRRRIVVGVVERVAGSRGIVNRRGLAYVPVPMIAGPQYLLDE